MKRLVLLFAFAFMAVFSSGCSSKHMQPADPTVAEAHPGPDETKIVFFRSTTLGGAIQAFLCEEKDGKLEYVAIVSAGAKVAHKTTPGKHVYLTGAENGELLEANMEGGKTYYAYVSPRMGMWKARFVFVPVTGEMLSTDGFKKDLAWCDWRESNREGLAWFSENLPSLNEKYIDALSDYTKNPDERKILHPEDGSSVPIF